MSIQTELTRLTNAKAAIKAAIEGKGVTVPSGTLLDGMAALIEAIEAGGGGDTQIDGLIDRSITEISNGRVTKIGDYAFYKCTSLTTADFPAATSIGESAFCDCSNLTAADFPAATSVAMNAFDYCRSLTTLDLPAAMYIDSYAMRYCSSLTTLDLPAAKSLGAYVFAGDTNIITLILRNTDAVCKLSNKNAFNNTPIASGTGYIYVPSALVDSYKAATNWSTYANQIRAIEDYPDITGGAA